MSPYFRLSDLAISEQAKLKTRQGIALTAAVLLSICSVAQTSTARPENSSDQSTAKVTTSKATASVPAGTRIGLILTQPIQTRYVHRGDDIYAQITAPVTSGNEVVIPPGTFVQGKVDRLERQGGRGELRLRSLAISFPDGYVANVSGPVTLETDDGYAVKDPGKGRLFGAFAIPAAGLGLGALIGHAVTSNQPQTLTNSNAPGCTGGPPFCVTSSLTTPASSLKSTAIGSFVGLAAGGVVSVALLFGSHNFFLEAGAPVSMILHQPIVLPEDEVAAAIRDAQQESSQDQPDDSPPPFMP